MAGAAAIHCIAGDAGAVWVGMARSPAGTTPATRNTIDTLIRRREGCGVRVGELPRRAVRAIGERVLTRLALVAAVRAGNAGLGGGLRFVVARGACLAGVVVVGRVAEGGAA